MNEDKYQYYWDMKKLKESNKPLDWDKIVDYTIVYPSFVLFGVLFVLAKAYS